jgi:hypothetical protein
LEGKGPRARVLTLMPSGARRLAKWRERLRAGRNGISQWSVRID